MPTRTRLLMTLLVVGAVGHVRAGVEKSGVQRRSHVRDVGSTCTSNENCTQDEFWEEPSPQCVDGECKCIENMCKVAVQFSVVSSNDGTFYCGECGSFGSQCESSNECLARDSVCKSGYCGCTYGTSFYGVCNVVMTNSSASPINLTLTGILILIIICNKCISSKSIRRQWRRLTRRCFPGSREEQAICQVDADGTYHNPRSSGKSPSYALGNQDFYASSDDPDLDWAIELSLLETARRPSASSSARSAASDGQQPTCPPSSEITSCCGDIPENTGDSFTGNVVSDSGAHITVPCADGSQAASSGSNNQDVSNGCVAVVNDYESAEDEDSKNFKTEVCS